MNEIINQYKKISNDILKLLQDVEVDNDKLDIYLEQRQNVIENINKDNKKVFAEEYQSNLSDIDLKIKELLQKRIDYSKKELANYRKNQNGNIAYANMNKMNLNIFYKKV